MSYPEAVTYLLNGETGQVIHGGSPPRETAGKRAARPRGEETTEEKEPKISLKEELEAKIAESAKAEEERKNKTTGRKPAAKSRRNKQQEK